MEGLGKIRCCIPLSYTVARMPIKKENGTRPMYFARFREWTLQAQAMDCPEESR